MRIDLGCGPNKLKGHVGVDIVKVKGVDIVHDCEKGLPFDDDVAEEVRAWDFLEHVSNTILLMNEIWRVLQHDGVLKFKVPDAERGQGAFQDPTHKSFWVSNSFKYFESRRFVKLYGIKAHFKIEKIKSVEYEYDYWGKNYALIGRLRAIKKEQKVQKVQKRAISREVYTTDDLSVDNLKFFKYWDKVKEKQPDLKLIAFVIAEGIDKSDKFKEWWVQRKDWVEIGVHCYNHKRPQEGWRTDQEVWIEKALDILKPHLPENFLYRPPGFRVLPKTEGVLKKLGFAGIAHQSHIKMFDGQIIGPLLNTHCSGEESCLNRIEDVWEGLV